MSKQIQVNLAFNADTAKAKTQINELVASLNKIATKDTQLFDDRGLREASSAAKDLTTHLQNAVNINTGKLDLNKFTQSLLQSKQSLSDLYTSLSKAGPEGQQAFLQLASSIASSESQVLNLNAKVKDLGQTLKNTVKWQLSSSLIHGFMGAMQHAIGYARDLNSSLNDIRIVTGASVDEMAKFAEQANKSAKALSSTTTEYTKASLIYYQQGLSDDEVKERTDVTIKMANVSKESAQIVSDQMTAVWNNFYDGSKSLEYYADVMTALGAATSSSVDEIAGGLEKFAAIGDTIGLSYEYAASALATITSNTRESEEVVGTALKTIFARIQGLQLGETLDDGTTLNKYSQALESVGISIFDQTGELKTMDALLDDMGRKWQTLSKDQQIALAQTVAGTRQYTQLVALMDNWNNGDNDSFQANLATAYGSSGALQEQQDIYAEGWEAAADRVAAATEDIYDSLINDEAIVVLLNGLEKILTFTGALIDGFGGLKGILLLVSGIFARQFAKDMPAAISKLKDNFDIITGKAQKKKENDIQENINIIQTQLNNNRYKTDGDKLRAKSVIEESQALLNLEKNRNRLTTAQQENIQKIIEERKASQDLQATILDEINVTKKKFNQTKKSAQSKEDSKTTIKDRIEELEKNTETEKVRATEIRNKKSSDRTLDDDTFIKEYEKKEKLRNLMADLEGAAKELDFDIDTTSVVEGIDKITTKIQELSQKQEQFHQITEEFQGKMDSFDMSIDIIGETDDIEKQKKEFEALSTSILKYAERLSSIEDFEIDSESVKKLKIELDNLAKQAGESGADIKKLAEQAKAAFKTQINGSKVFEHLISGADLAESEIEEVGDQIKFLINALQLLTPDKFKELAAEAEKSGQSIATLILQQQKASAATPNVPKMSPQEPMEFSTALTTVASVGMEVSSILSSLSGVASVWADEGATAAQKFIAVLSSMPAILFSIADIMKIVKSGDFISAISSMGTSMTVLAGKLPNLFGKVGASAVTMGTNMAASGAAAGTAAGGFTALGGGLLALLPYIAAVAVAIAALYGIIKLIDWAIVTPEEELEAAKEATEAMTTAANDANAAYQNLLNTISGYDSAVSALEDLEIGTQGFTNALITANEKAWELIDTYGLLQGQDWNYGDNGEIVIEQSAKDRIIKEVNDIRENAIIAQSVATVNEKEAAYNLAKSEADYWGNTLTEDTRQNLYDALGFTDGSSKSLFNKWEEASNAGDDSQIINEIGKKYWGDKWDNTDIDMVDFIRNSIANMDKIGNMFNAYQDYNIAKENQFDKQVSTVMSDEEAYQQSSWKGAINDYLEENYDKTKSESEVNNWDDERIKQEYQDYLKDTYIEEDGKYYRKDAQGNKTGEAVEGLIDLTVDAQREILLEQDTWNQLEEQGIAASESLNRIANNMSDSQKDYADAFMNTDLSSLTEEQVEAFKTGEMSLKEAIGSSNYEQLLSEFGPEFMSELEDNWNKAIENYEPPTFNIEDWKKSYQDQMNIAKDLEMGDTIDSSQYEQLGVEAQAYFQLNKDGLYTLIGDAQQLKSTIDAIETAKLAEGISDVKDKTGWAPEQAQYFQDQAEAGTTQGFMSLDQLNEYRDTVNEIFKQKFETPQEAIDFMNQLQEAAASAAESIGQIQQGLKNGSMDSEGAISALQMLGASYENSVDDLQAYNEALESGTAAQKKAAEEALVMAVRAGELGEECDIAGEEIEDLAELMAEQEEYAEASGEALAQLAKDQLRWNRGAKKAESSMKDWTKSLKDFNEKGVYPSSEVLSDLADTYGDLLDIDGDSLSKDFLTNTKNLELMQEALKGNEGAYQELQQLAGEEILASIGIDKSQYASDLAEIQGMAATAEGQGLADVEAGASLDNADFLAALTEMVNAAGMTAAQATDYLSSMGVDATVVEKTQQTTETVATDLQATLGEASAEYIVPASDGSPQSMTATFPTVTYNQNPVPSVKETTAVGLEVVSANKSSGGNVKATGGGGGGSKGGGGGGGGGKDKKPQKAKTVKKTDVVKRYKRVDDKIDDVTNAYDKASKSVEKLYGNARIKQMEKVNNLLEQEIGLIEQKRHEAEAYLKEDLSSLQKAAQEAGVQFEIDDQGLISNYEEVMSQLYNELNSAINSANADGDATEEEQENIDKIQEKIDSVTEAIEQYDETRELIEDLDNDIEEKLYEIYDNELEMLEYKFEVQLELNEDDMAVLEYQFDRINDDAFKAAESIALINQQMENLYNQVNANKAALEEVFGVSAYDISIDLFGNDETLTEEQIELMKEYRDNLLDINEQYDDLRATVEEKVMEVFDAWNEKLETSMDNMEHYSSVLESYKNIVDIVGQTTLGLSDTFMAGMEQKVFDNALDNMKATQAAYDTMVKAKAEAEAALAEAQANGDEKSAKLWEETLIELNANMQEAQEDFLGSWEDTLDLLSEHFEAAVERVIDTFNEAVYAYGGLEGLSKEFSRQQEMADAMVDDYAKIYELSKLNRNIQKTIDDTDVIAGKQKLKKLQQEINALTEDGVEMSKYDLEYLQAEYELRMAEIELENAQAKKDTVQLSKDNEGNWSYVYTTSTDAVDAAQQKYEDALYAMQELSSNYIDEMSEQLISTSQEMAEALAEVQAADFANEEEYKAELDRIRKQYEEMMAQQQAELNKAIDNNDELYNKDMLAYEQATNGKYAVADNFATAFKDTLLGTLMDSESLTANFNEIMRSSVDILTTGLVKAASTYYSHLSQAMEAAGTSTDTFAEDMSANIEEVSKQSEEGAKAVEDMGQRMSDAFAKITEEVTTWQQTYGLAMEDIIQSNLDVITSFNEMLKELSVDPDAIHVTYDISTDYGINQAASMDTGGYTGEWGNTGKLAILHEKEMVLNADDTLRLLEAMNISRTILETIELNARQASAGMGSLQAISVKEDNSETLEQNVHITAEFPSVTDHNEIEEAMKNLINTASQYANRK